MNILTKTHEKLSDAMATENTTTYADTSSILMGFLDAKVYVYVNGGKNFTGLAGGTFLYGWLNSTGNVSTNDLNALYGNTRSFYVNVTLGAITVTFFDSASKVLGSYSAIGDNLSLSGLGGGSGSWA